MFPMLLNQKQSWTVITEGDVEGRTTENLGTFFGNILELAKALGEKQCWGLYFIKSDLTKSECEPIPTPSKINSTVHLSINNFHQDKLLNDMRSSFPKESIEQSTYYKSIKINFKTKKKQKELSMEDHKKNALKKLTKLEKQALGLI